MTEILTKMIEFPSNGGTTPGFLAQPSDNGQWPGVILLQEWWGLVPHILEVAERLAGEGFVVLAPDLYHGQRAAEPDEARKLSMALDRQRAIREVSAAAKLLVSLEGTHPRIGVMGFCMGGGLSLSAAAHDSALGAVVCFYGRPLEAADTARIKCPVLGFFGEEDGGIPLSLVYDFQKALTAHQIVHDIHVYAGAQHAFFNDSRPAYHPDAAADAWQRTLDWFRAHLDTSPVL